MISADCWIGRVVIYRSVGRAWNVVVSRFTCSISVSVFSTSIGEGLDAGAERLSQVRKARLLTLNRKLNQQLFFASPSAKNAVLWE